MLKRSTSAVAY